MPITQLPTQIEMLSKLRAQTEERQQEIQNSEQDTYYAVQKARNELGANYQRSRNEDSQAFFYQRQRSIDQSRLLRESYSGINSAKSKYRQLRKQEKLKREEISGYKQKEKQYKNDQIIQARIKQQEDQQLATSLADRMQQLKQQTPTEKYLNQEKN